MCVGAYYTLLPALLLQVYFDGVNLALLGVISLEHQGEKED